MEEGIIMLPSGRNEVIWLAEDRKGNAAEATQIVNLRPLVSLSKDQTTVRGSTVSFAMVLNGPSPFYPLTVPFVIDEASTLSGADHDLVSGSVTFTEGQTRATVQVQFASGIGSADETLVVRLDDHTPGGEVLAAGYDPDNPDIHDINSGNKATHVITVVDRNLPPKASFVLQQAGANTLFITRDDGPVTVTANVIDPNPGDSHGFDWSGTDNILVDVGGDLDQGVLVFDPAYLSSGRYKVQVQVTDSEGATGTANLHFRVVDALPEAHVARRDVPTPSSAWGTFAEAILTGSPGSTRARRSGSPRAWPWSLMTMSRVFSMTPRSFAFSRKLPSQRSAMVISPA
jgi:hypothetical protein